MFTLGPMSPEQARRAMLSLSIKALLRPNEPVSPAEVVLYEMIYEARNPRLAA